MDKQYFIKFCKDNYLAWRDNDLVMWTSPYCIQELVEAIGYDIMEKHEGIYAFIFGTGHIEIVLNEICELLDIDMEDICPR